ncbi:MAG: hypothetical protein RR517_26530 [Pseudomonas sp.]
MSKVFGLVRFLPLQFGLGYLLATLLLFFFGPFDWPLKNEDVLLLFLTAVLLALCLGFSIGVIKRAPGARLQSWRVFFRIGALFSIALLFPSTWAYTGKWPWEVMSVLGDQGQAYRDMLVALEANESGIRNYVAMVRGLAAPFVCCVIPFAILNWRSMRAIDVLLLAGHISAILIFSLMRGTDRETGDLVVFFMTAFLILGCQAIVRHGRLPFSFGKMAVSAVLLLSILFGAFVLFVERKESRMGGSEDFCIAEGIVCSHRSASASELDAKTSFALEMLTGYTAQGYYGLSLALQEDFTSTLGLGHSAFLISTFTKAVDESLYERSYLHKVDLAGWNDKAQWSTLFTWIASDISFPLVPLAIAVLGFLWGSAWKSAVLWNSEAGALVFLFLTLSVLYMPANNQLTQTLDSYFAFLFWLTVWLSQGRGTHATANA